MQVNSGLTGSGAVRDRRGITSTTSSGQLVQGVTHRISSLVTVGDDTLADRTALQADESVVDARPGGVDPDGVAAVARHLELVARIVFTLILVGHPGQAQIVGSTPNRRPTRPHAVAAFQRAASPPTVAPQIDGTSRGDLPVVTRGTAPTLGISADLSGAAFPGSRSRA
jgi:hypothetical protein